MSAKAETLYGFENEEMDTDNIADVINNNVASDSEIQNGNSKILK